jgi:hypothetical protein
MNPLLAKIREQLPSEAVPFGLVVRGEVLEEQLSAFTKLAKATEEGTHEEPGNLFYRFFFSAQNPLEYVRLKLGQIFPRWPNILRRHIFSDSLRIASHSPENVFRLKYSWEFGIQATDEFPAPKF